MELVSSRLRDFQFLQVCRTAREKVARRRSYESSLELLSSTLFPRRPQIPIENDKFSAKKDENKYVTPSLPSRKSTLQNARTINYWPVHFLPFIFLLYIWHFLGSSANLRFLVPFPRCYERKASSRRGINGERNKITDDFPGDGES